MPEGVTSALSPCTGRDGGGGGDTKGFAPPGEEHRMSIFRPWPSVAGPGPGDPVPLTPQDAGWNHAGLRVLRLEPGVPRTIETGDAEAFVLPLAGGLTVEVAPHGERDVEARFELTG